MIINEDFMGPEFSLTISGILPDELATLREQTEQQPMPEGDDCEDLNEEIENLFMSKICSLTDGFLFRTSLPPASFRCEQESEPFATLYQEEDPVRYILHWSLNVCFESNHYDEVSSIIYSEAFETFLVKNSVTVFIEILKEKCPFLSTESVSAELDGIGEA